MKALRSFQFTTENEIHGSAIEMAYRDAVNPHNLTFSGKKNGTEVVTRKDHEWYVVSGKQGTYLEAFVIPESNGRIGELSVGPSFALNHRQPGTVC